jgi:hypothetical protein
VLGLEEGEIGGMGLEDNEDILQYLDSEFIVGGTKKVVLQNLEGGDVFYDLVIIYFIIRVGYPRL